MWTAPEIAQVCFVLLCALWGRQKSVGSGSWSPGEGSSVGKRRLADKGMSDRTNEHVLSDKRLINRDFQYLLKKRVSKKKIK